MIAQAHLVHRTAITFAAALVATGLTGCQGRKSVNLDDPDVSTFVQLMMPQQIQIQRYLTRPVSFSGDGNLDGLEVIVAALDSFGDPVKVVGTFHFELYAGRRGGDDSLGERLAFWPVEIDSSETLREHWDRLSRYYRFPLKIESTKGMAAGRYTLVARLRSPLGETLFDQYEFDQSSAIAPAATPAP